MLGWITNPDLNLSRFAKRRVDKILRVAPNDVWNYVSTEENPAHVGTRDGAFKKSDSVKLWLEGPKFLSEAASSEVVTLCMSRLENESRESCDFGLDQIIESSSALYVLKKRAAYLNAFVEYVVATVKGRKFYKPVLNVAYLDLAFLKVVKYVQSRNFGAAIKLLSGSSPDKFEAFVSRWSKNATDPDEKRRINELKTLRNLRPCIGQDLLLRVDGRLENADLPVNTKHPIILPGRHPLTRLIVLSEHCRSGHAGSAYTLMKTRQCFWIIHGIGNVKYFLNNCGKCALSRVKPVRQLMSDLHECRLTVTNKPFRFSGFDYFGPYSFREGRSTRKAWGMLFTCLCTRILHVELVTSLDLNSFLLAFSRFTNLRGAVDTIYSDNGSTFCAAADRLRNFKIRFVKIISIGSKFLLTLPAKAEVGK